jgi:hypothetical protein
MTNPTKTLGIEPARRHEHDNRPTADGTLTVAWSQHLSAQGASAEVHFEQVWSQLLDKASAPEEFVPAITASVVLGRLPDGCLRRRIARDGRDIEQRISIDRAAGRIVFEHVDDPDLVAIVNELRLAPDGGLIFVMSVELTSARSREIIIDDGFLSDLDDYYRPTLDAVVATLSGSPPLS